MRNILETLLVTIITIAVLIALVVGLNAFETSQNDDSWNSGICRYDGSKLTYNNSSIAKGSRTDFYICENGHIVELVNDFKIRS